MNAAIVFYIYAGVYYKPILSAKYVDNNGDKLSIVVYKSKLLLNGREYKIKSKRNDTLIISKSTDLPKESIVLKDTSVVRHYFSNGFPTEVVYKRDSLPG